MSDTRPILGVSMGDPAGIGVEVILKHIIYELSPKYRFVIFGSPDVFEFYMDKFNLALNINLIESPDEIPSLYKDGELNIIQATKLDTSKLKIGQLSSECGRAAFESFTSAIDAALKNRIDAIVTAPLNKEAMNLAGFKYPGHTEILAERTNTKDYVMMLAAKRFRIALVTTHVALRDVAKLITKERVLKTIRIVNNDLKKWFGIKAPRIAVASLNPHNSEGGIMGDEEEKHIVPAIKDAQKEGIVVEGTFSADTMFVKDRRSKYDCFISMYHDQGLAVLKALYFDNSVNITLGIPIIRTSPDHGTAFDIAGRFIANHKSFSEATRQAYRMSRWKQKNS
ncbi:4-hydroxythreonine-4-phosphate dehydrogenase PdxA [Hippea maritima]|uniref:4-hydroxythreonine-4-phosphate dehydrogenase n=1 Tax=Hippea maritima (strain ATCC 700847 / DSM 10411 / MH2) TaxID=760142 RepID=F2LWP1_HIPMA|nr:4-hydroxythreonine-4-phosphate dehydrogenase PdxA [Hippea maritima]AEA33019.1 4-hydroxythreonine-4-phosphate dehydrogenase [Hippea maritima DSM 10411]